MTKISSVRSRNSASLSSLHMDEKLSDVTPSKGVTGDLEFVWTDADFSRVQSLIYHRAGISLHDGKHAMVYSRLSRRLRDTKHRSFKDYLDSLDAQDSPEWQEFINALTTNLTSFFREAHHFDILSAHLKSGHAGRSWRIWCSAASTGEEPYSIAMTAVDVMGEKGDFFLTASDIDSKVLASASKGIFRVDGLKGLNEGQISKYFLRGRGDNAGLARVKSTLQSKMEFLNVNLTRDDWPFRKPFDLVFCRNVMIYFDPLTQRRVLERIHSVMSPGGLLFVGHAENFGDSRDLFILKGKTVYERC